MLLAELCELTWLSVHRKSESSEEDSTRSYDSSVDQRIDEISNRFNQYVTEIDTLVKREGREFEKKLFSSIITDPKQDNITDQALLKINLEQQKRLMSVVFEDLGFDEYAYKDRLDRHYDLAATARAKHTDKKGVGVRDFLTISSLFQAEQTIKFWLEYQKKVSDHNRGRTNIISMLESYFKDKEPIITDEGRVFFLVKRPSSSIDKNTRGISVVSPFQLSSGEKQLYIFLMEALLEKNKTVVYIADEPELSMHITWQESLVSSLKSLNPNAQFIFATHSPDIISSFTSSVINLEAASQ